MEIFVTGRHGVESEMREYAEEKLGKLAQVFDRLTSAKVILDRDASGCRAEASVHAPQGRILVARSEAPEMKAALDELEHRLLAQARKLKAKLEDGRREGPGRGAA